VSDEQTTEAARRWDTSGEIRGVQIPKPTGGMRQLGIPTVVDMDLEKFFDRVNHDVENGSWNRFANQRPPAEGGLAPSRGLPHTPSCWWSLIVQLTWN
jgi:hypothetical protein